MACEHPAVTQDLPPVFRGGPDQRWLVPAHDRPVRHHAGAGEDDPGGVRPGHCLAARLRQGLSLRDLAERAEVSPSLLSKIENGKANPSVRSLHSIAEALSLPLTYFFWETDEEEPPAVPEVKSEPGPARDIAAGQLQAGQAAQLIGSDALEFGGSEEVQAKKPVVRANARPTIELLGGIIWSRLIPQSEDGIEFMEIYYEPGASSGEKMTHHAAREFQLVLEGELLLELGFERYLLKPGDSIIFDSKTPHRLSNVGQVPMRAISVIFGPMKQPLSI